MKFSTWDVDNDTSSGGACGRSYSGMPFWYANCWGGSINGGGEATTSAYYNGAYWSGSARSWGTDGGGGAGNGWLFVK